MLRGWTRSKIKEVLGWSLLRLSCLLCRNSSCSWWSPKPWWWLWSWLLLLNCLIITRITPSLWGLCWRLLLDCPSNLLLIVLYIFCELFLLVFIKPCGVVVPIITGPLFVNILVGQKLSDFLIASVGIWLPECLWHIGLPICIHHIVAELLEHFYFTWWPFVEVHRFNLGDVHSKLAMNTYFKIMGYWSVKVTYLSI